jgi:NAD(P)-dependent dehydrogenase (short-subunit alcohol dehydrogenase family)
MNKPVTIVTGASRGIGHATCIELAKRGHHIVAIARTVGALEELADQIGDENITLIPQDLMDGMALEKLGPLLFDKFGRVDNVVLNAGMLGTLCPLSQCDPTEWDRVFKINVTANVHLIRTLHPIVSKAEKSNMVFVTSGVANHPRAYWGAYAASKAALENMAKIYEQEMEQTGLTVHIFNPGRTATKMQSAAFPGVNPDGLNKPKDVAIKIADLL